MLKSATEKGRWTFSSYENANKAVSIGKKLYPADWWFMTNATPSFKWMVIHDWKL